MFGLTAVATSTTTATTTSAGITASLFSTSTTASAPSTTAQTPLAFGTSLTTPLSTASGGVSSTEPAGADAASKLSLKGLLEKEGSVGSACSQLLAALTADTEISFADLSAVSSLFHDHNPIQGGQIRGGFYIRTEECGIYIFITPLYRNGTVIIDLHLRRVQ
ncbi:hypothetical protein Y032_0303g1888 [Ancylostoma ceylanicum]|uniref:Uncharacterized protein n=1 Tax=Ancylostoma ceylanicum TaxID=53326 RepID=A0A016S3D9_9BILA|nr:hypothetical protein Y032_0303g1888 [Ancylostoma ceylanicum]